MKKEHFIFILFFFIQSALPAEQLPSYSVALLKDKSPERKIVLLDSIAIDLRNKDFPTSVLISKEAIKIAKENKKEVSISKLYLTLSLTYRKEGRFDTCLLYIDSAKTFAHNKKFTQQYANIADAEGLIYMRMGNYEKATSCFYECIKYSEEQEDSLKLYQGFEHLGTLSFYRRDHKSAVKFYKQALKSASSKTSKKTYFLTLDNIGLAYSNLEMMDSALHYQKKGVAAIEKMQDSSLMAESYINIGSTLLVMKLFDESEYYFKKAFEIQTVANDSYGLLIANLHLGRLYLERSDPRKALPFLEKSYNLAVNLKLPHQIKESLKSLTEGYAATSDYKKSTEYYQLLVSTMDKIYEEENSKAINELSTQYETEKKQKEIQLLTSEKELQIQRIEKDKYVKLFTALLAVFLMVLCLIFVYRFRKKKKDNQLLLEKNEAIAKQKEKIEIQKELLQNKNQEITDSINYSKRIQASVLPSDKLIHKLLPHSFIYFQPKDIVSGDFYWVCENNGFIFCAVADCTGHGVPGAMMSMLGASLLNQIVINSKTTSPAEILKELHYHVLKTLNENMEHQESKDGMDVALIRMDPINKKVLYAGAGRPLYVIKNRELYVYKPDKNSIGSTNNSNELNYNSHTIDISEPTQLYLFSDGVPDQFGGEKGKKLMTKNLLSFLLASSTSEVIDQQKQFIRFFESWKKELEQTDDVTLLSIRLS